MSDWTTQVRELRDELSARGEAIIEKAAAEGRNTLNAIEQRDFDEIVENVKDADARLEELRENERRQGLADKVRAEFGNIWGGGVSSDATARSIREAVANGDRRPIEVRMEGLRSGIEARDLLTTTGGGLTPSSFANQLVRSMVDGSGVLAAGARLLTTDSGETLNVPRGTASSTAAIVAEGGAITESDPTVDSVALGAYKYGFLLDVSNELLTDATFDVVSYLAEQAGEALGVGFGGHLISGTGTNQPTGILTSATVGVTGGTGVAGAFTADELIDLQHSLDGVYSRRGAWLMNVLTLGEVRKLKTSGSGDYIFVNDVTPAFPGSVGTLLGRPVYVDGSMPDVALGAMSVAYGDFSRVWVRQVRSVRFERSDAYRFGNDVVSFRALHRIDGALIDPSAIKVFVGGAS